MDRLELRDAYDQIAAIRIQLAATERLRGLRALPVAASGVLALAAAAAQSIWVHDPLRAPQQWLLLWLGAALLSTLAAGLELLRRVRSSGSDLSIANATLAVRQFAPCIAAGAVVTTFIAMRLPEQLWLLPGLWQLLFGLGNFAAQRLLPPAALAIAGLYFASGTAVLWLGERALHPWAMGLPFCTGQLALAGILWWQHERIGAEARQ